MGAATVVAMREVGWGAELAKRMPWPNMKSPAPTVSGARINSSAWQCLASEPKCQRVRDARGSALVSEKSRRVLREMILMKMT